jgi:F-type H+-transporting ATPase subunit O
MFNELMVAAKGEVTAHVTTAQELDAAGQAAMSKSLDELLAKGQAVTVSYSVDPGLISGHTIEMGDKFIDYSAATQLKKLTALLGIGV